MHTTQQNAAWVGQHRKHNSRQLAVIQPVTNEEFTDFKVLAGLAHPNIARLRALYHKGGAVHVVYDFAIACIRVTSAGTIKIVLDWTYESVREPSIQEALRSHIAIWLHETMQSLGCGRQHWTSDALAVFEQLNSGHLPMITDPFFANVRPLREATQTSPLEVAAMKAFVILSLIATALCAQEGTYTCHYTVTLAKSRTATTSDACDEPSVVTCVTTRTTTRTVENAATHTGSTASA
ncbi:hypothetical protein Purlil1_14181 [Purpureocillium lilacinum]|uniref:Protein kinase domain-containing protein n=1 Tax=Purpureocillium lilacinum TaxID=33203 RepID=A0ABR0BC07_PURLI|nr:hypothetical protein Purlil1_14181 [Purpureocillium lilacinum]